MTKLIFTHHPLATDTKLNEIRSKITAQLNEQTEIKAQRELRKSDDMRPSDWEDLISQTVTDFDVLVITTLKIGRATCKAANLMLVKGTKKVLFFTGKDLLPVRFIKEIDAKDWKQGWMVIYGDRRQQAAVQAAAS